MANEKKETVFRMEDTFSFRLESSHEEVLRFTDNAFYVRGVKVEGTEQEEARAVFEAFRDWVCETQPDNATTTTHAKPKVLH